MKHYVKMVKYDKEALPKQKSHRNKSLLSKIKALLTLNNK